MRTVVKKELALQISEQFNISHNVSLKIVQRFLDQIVEELNAGNRIELRNFGVFEVRTRKSRIARNPRTGEKVQVPEKKTVIFKPGKELLNPERINAVRQEYEDGARESGGSMGPLTNNSSSSSLGNTVPGLNNSNNENF